LDSQVDELVTSASS